MTTKEIDELKTAVRGRVTMPGDPTWDEDRRAFNLAVDQRPAAVVHASDADDVAAVLRHAAANGLRVAPQATGHGCEGLADLSGAILLKTGALKEIEIDAQNGIARIGAGALAGDVAAAAAEQRFVAPTGLAPSVGVTGLALGGGTGWLSRCQGFTCNSVRGFEVVTAAGEQTRADHATNPDLFWALRGGGGRFAVVTATELELRPAGEISAGMLAWPAENAGEVLERFRRWTAEAPHALMGVLRYVSLPPIDAIPEPLRGKRIVALIAAYLGEAKDAEELIAPWRGGTLLDTFGPISADGLVRVAGDPEQPIPSRSDGMLLADLSRGATEKLAALVENDELAPLSVLEVRQLGGALAREQPGDGVLSGVTEPFSLFAGGPAPTPEAGEAVQQRIGVLREHFKPWLSRRILLGSAGAGTDPTPAFDERTWRRLHEVKATYDPDDLIQAPHA